MGPSLTLISSRLALLTILNAKMDDFFILVGLLCSSYVAINRATNRRFPFSPLGDCSVTSVIQGNLLTTRYLGMKLYREGKLGGDGACIDVYHMVCIGLLFICRLW